MSWENCQICLRRPQVLYSRPVNLLVCVRNVMAHAQKPDFVFRRNGRVHLSRQGRQLSLLAAEVCASPVVMLDTTCSEVVWRVLASFPFTSLPCVSVCHHISTGPYQLADRPVILRSIAVQDAFRLSCPWAGLLSIYLFIYLIYCSENLASTYRVTNCSKNQFTTVSFSLCM